MSRDGPLREISYRTPFKSPLVDSGFKSPLDNIMSLKSNPEKIVRVSSIYRPDNVQGWFVRHKQVLNKLKNEYGFNIPDIDIVIGPGENEREQRVYIVTDRIYGQVLRDKQFRPSEIPTAREKLDVLFNSIIQYYWDVTRQGGDYNDDLAQHNSQFVWGRKKGDTEDTIYLVDVGPQIETHKLDSMSNGHLIGCLRNKGFSSYGYGVYEDIAFLERKHNFRFEGARQKLGQFMDDLLARGPLEKWDVPKVNTLKLLAES